MKTTMTAILLMSLLSAGVPCRILAAEGGIREVKLREAVEAIVEEVPFIDEPASDLMENKKMKALYRHPKDVLPAAERLIIQTPSLSKVEVKVVMLALQCAALDEYLPFLVRLGSRPKGEIIEWALFYGVAPDIEWSNLLAIEYRNVRVRTALSDLLKSPNTNASLRVAIQSILSGNMAQYLIKAKEKAVLRCPVLRRE